VGGETQKRENEIKTLKQNVGLQHKRCFVDDRVVQNSEEWRSCKIRGGCCCHTAALSCLTCYYAFIQFFRRSRLPASLQPSGAREAASVAGSAGTTGGYGSVGAGSRAANDSEAKLRERLLKGNLNPTILRKESIERRLRGPLVSECVVVPDCCFVRLSASSS